MLIHSLLEMSEVNGPGKRAVIWFQGCSLGCKGCWNPETHVFSTISDMDFDHVMAWIRKLKGVEGITFSGGEPMQQAPALYLLMYQIKKEFPKMTIGMFSGYSRKELEHGKFKWKSAFDADWRQGSDKLWKEINQFLDFAVLGRYNQTVPANEPLRSSLNQEVIFFTDAYKEKDMPPQAVEIDINNDDALVTITGFPTKGFRKDYGDAGGEGELVPA